jgi:DNA-binding SARP family transcriptional activator
MIVGDRLNVLGPLELQIAGAVVEARRPKTRALLTVLAVRANRLVSTDYLTSALWDGPPPSAAANLRNYLTEVHRLLGGVADSRQLRLVRMSAGALLQADVAHVDVLEFCAELGTARDCASRGDLTGAARHYRRGLWLWRGEVVDWLSGGTTLAREVKLVDDLRLDAIEEYADVRLELGDHVRLAEELRPIVVRHPYRERAWGSLMIALYRSGQAAAALEAYREAERVLRVELGLTPTPRLRKLQNAVLRHDHAVLAPQRPVADLMGDTPGAGLRSF